MNSKNDALKIVIHLTLSAAVYYLFTFKYKEQLIATLSLQVYYQALVIVVIINSYVAKWLDNLIGAICHSCMLSISKKYKRKHLKEITTAIAKRSQGAKLSKEAAEMVADMTKSDFELEGEISEAFEEMNKIKRNQKK